MIVFYVFGTIILFVIALFIGLYISSNIENPVIYVFFWLLYVVSIMTVINIMMTLSFYGNVRNKMGPPGPRGYVGEKGESGNPGLCDSSCRNKICYKKILDFVGQKVNDLAGNPSPPIQIKNVFLTEKMKQMCHSRDYQRVEPLRGGAINLINYLKKIWGEWVTILYDEGGRKYFETIGAETDWKWKNNNPFDELKKYDVYYWGLPKEFKQRQIEICNNPHKNPNMPQAEQPILRIIPSNNYDMEWHSFNTGMSKMSVWKPLKTTMDGEVYYPMGYYALPGSSSKSPKNKILDNSTIEGTQKLKANVRDGKFNKCEVDAHETINVTSWGRNYSQNFCKSSHKCDVGKGDCGRDSGCKSYLQCKQRDNNEDVPGVNFKGTGVDRKTDVCHDPYFTDTTGISPPKTQTMLVTGKVKGPVGWEIKWDLNKNGKRGSAWTPIPPPGYRCLGDVITRSPSKPLTDLRSPIRCVPKKCATRLPGNVNKSWKSIGSGSSKHLTVLDMNDGNSQPSNQNSYNLFRTHPNDSPKSKNKQLKTNSQFYYLNDKCLLPTSKKPKETGKNIKEVGAMGWFGSPKRNPKYSIYSYLEMVEEAIITNKATGRKYYIIHTGRNYTNSYNILRYESNTGKYTKALTRRSGNTVDITNHNNEDQNQEWVLEYIGRSKDEFYMKHNKTGKYLHHKLDLPLDDNIREDKRGNYIEKLIPKESKLKEGDNVVFVLLRSTTGNQMKD